MTTQNVEEDKKLKATVKKFGKSRRPHLQASSPSPTSTRSTCSRTTTPSCTSASPSVSRRPGLTDALVLPLTFIIIVQFSVRENLLVVTGGSETKQLKDMLPDIIKQVGPQQYDALKNLMGDFGKAAGKQDEDDEDDVPPLVQGTFEDASKK